MTDVQAVMFEGLIAFPVGTDRIFRHGSCKGADVQAARIARRTFRSEFGLQIHSHPGPDGDPCREDSGVDDVVHPGMTHFARNRKIVDNCNELIACPCDMTEQTRGGTWYTINYARKKGTPVTIIWPDGSLD